MWLSTLTSRAHTNDAVLAVAHDLASVTASRALYGGDVTATARLLNSLARRMANDVIDFPDVAQREAMVTELVNIAVATGSNLVGGQQAAWADLRPLEHRAAATSLLLGLEEAAFLLANNLHHEKTVRLAEANIRECHHRHLCFYIHHNYLSGVKVFSSSSLSTPASSSPRVLLLFIRFSSPLCIY